MKHLPGLSLSLVITLLLTFDLGAKSLEDILKGDFTAQQTIQIKFFVNKRLYSFEAGKHKIGKINKNKKKVWAITKKIVPWAIFEHMKPNEVARIIVYMYHADQAGASFDDSEDLIPMIASKEIPLNKFIIMVQYNRETKRADIPEAIRQLFLTEAYNKGWDGASIMAGGRGLILAKSSGMDVNKVASLLLKKIPSNGSGISSDRLISIVKKAINYNPRVQKLTKSAQILRNLALIHKTLSSMGSSPKQLRQIVRTTKKIDSQTKKIGRIKIPARKRTTKELNREGGIIRDFDKKPVITKKTWKTLSRSSLMSAISKWLGTRYKWGGKTGPPRGPGLDCSGFVRIVLVDSRIAVPRVPHGSRNQAKVGKRIRRRNIRAGDMIFFSASSRYRSHKVTHVAIATENKKFAHSSNRGVVFDNLTKRHWDSRYLFAQRVFFNVID